LAEPVKNGAQITRVGISKMKTEAWRAKCKHGNGGGESASSQSSEGGEGIPSEKSLQKGGDSSSVIGRENFVHDLGGGKKRREIKSSDVGQERAGVFWLQCKQWFRCREIVDTPQWEKKGKHAKPIC